MAPCAPWLGCAWALGWTTGFSLCPLLSLVPDTKAEERRRRLPCGQMSLEMAGSRGETPQWPLETRESKAPSALSSLSGSSAPRCLRAELPAVLGPHPHSDPVDLPPFWVAKGPGVICCEEVAKSPGISWVLAPGVLEQQSVAAWGGYSVFSQNTSVGSYGCQATCWLQLETQMKPGQLGWRAPQCSGPGAPTQGSQGLVKSPVLSRLRRELEKPGMVTYSHVCHMVIAPQ